MISLSLREWLFVLIILIESIYNIHLTHSYNHLADDYEDLKNVYFREMSDHK